MTDTIHDVIIVGSGPAGYTAAIYAARAELKPVVFEGVEFGGSLMTTTEVENFPGFAEGIQGPDLMDQMRSQAERFGADLRMEHVDRMDLTGDVKSVWVGDEEHKGRTVILAMGAAPRYLGVPGEQELSRRQLLRHLRRFLFRDHDIAVIGGGDHDGGDVPDQVRQVRHHRPPPREFRACDHGGARPQQREDPLATNKVVEEVVGRSVTP